MKLSEVSWEELIFLHVESMGFDMEYIAKLCVSRFISYRRCMLQIVHGGVQNPEIHKCKGL